MRLSTLAALVMVAALTVGLSAQHESAQHGGKADAPTVTGAWNMSLQGDHVIPVGMELTQEGDTVTGKILMPTQHIGERKEISLAGGFVDGALELSGTAEGASANTAKLEITAKLEEDGSLSGTISNGRGTATWIAERLKRRPKS
jgi:hypothetical protein